MYFRKKAVWVALLVVSAAAVQTSAAQTLVSAIAAVTQKGKPAAAPADPLGRMTPRSAMSNFLSACHRDGLARAAQYLDLSRLDPSERAKQGPELALDVCKLINRDAQFELHNLSNLPEGIPDDGLEAGRDLLEAFHVSNQTVPLYLQRENRGGAEIWLVSADSIARLPELRSLTQETPLEKWLPRPLKIRFIGTSVWVWIVLVAIAIILAVVSRALSRAVIAVLQPLTPGRLNSTRSFRLAAFTEPLRLLVSVVIFRIAINFVPPSALLREYLLYTLSLLFVIGVAALIMRFADVISDQILARLDPKERALSYSVFRVGVRFAKICIFCIAVLFLLHQWGYKIDALLAGLGVGGLAVALAAQKTIENLFGGVSVISDRPVLVGDYCQFGSQAGTVEDIGLRSTRIRTNDRTLVTIPNATFSTMTLENFSRRDRMWFHPTLHLRRDTRPGQIREIMAAIAKLLAEHPMVDASGVPVRFTEIKNESFKIEIFAYVKTNDGNKFLVIQSELLLKILEAAEALNIGFAVPFYESVNVDAERQRTEPFVPLLESAENGTSGEERTMAREERV